MNDAFRRFAARISTTVGHPFTFVAAVIIIACWAITGPVFNFSDTWQLIINTSTTIITFLMVFIIQNTQNRDARAMQLKLDELIDSITGASNKFIDLEVLSDDELDKLQEQFHSLRDKIELHKKARSKQKDKL